MATKVLTSLPGVAGKGISDCGPDPLLRFVEIFNFKAFVEEYLIPLEEPNFSDAVRSSSRLVGQTKNGEVLYAWDRCTSEDEFVTTIGLYNVQSKANQSLYQLDTQSYIVNATINSEKTLLAYNVRESSYEEDHCNYNTYVAEIQPQGRTFDLNFRSPNFRALHFLHNEPSQGVKSRLSSKTIRTSHLLVVIPSVMICLYHFDMQIIRLGAVLVGQPEKEILHKNFAWYQWDPHTQWLYYARFETNSSMVGLSVSGKYSLMLSCENFSKPVHQLMFTISLPLPYDDQLYTSMATYFDNPFAFSLPIREMNLQVLYRRDGFWCVCLQHCTGVDPELSEHSMAAPSLRSGEGPKIDYTVYMLHNGHLLYGQVPFPQFICEPMYIHFMLVGNFVAAYIPDVMLHLLNIGPVISPSHHLTFGAEYSAFAVFNTDPTSSTPPSKPLQSSSGSGVMNLEDEPLDLVSAVTGALMGDYNTAVLDCSTETLYECNLQVQAFFELFKSTSDSELREDLLHLMIMAFRYHGLALSMIEHVCQTSMSYSDSRLFAEFIVASSFANFYFDCKRYFASQFPLSTSQGFRGKVSKNPDGGNRALLKVRPMTNFVQQLLVQSDQRLVMATPEELLNYEPLRNQEFENLCFNVVLNQSKYKRLDLANLPEEEKPPPLPEAPPPSKQGKGSKKGLNLSQPSGGLMNKISSFSRRQGKPLPQIPTAEQQQTLSFLTLNEDMAENLTAISTALKESILTSISKDLPLRSRNIAHNTTSTYCRELERQSCNLLQVIWQSLGFNSNNHPINSTLCRQPTPKEIILFELLEAYQLTHLQLGIPVPMGFHTLFISLGYITQDIVVFLQYMRNEVFTPTRKFVELLLEDCSEEDGDNVFQVICNLEYPLAKFALGRWQDPLVQQLTVNHVSIPGSSIKGQ